MFYKKKDIKKVILLLEKEDNCVIPDECADIIPRAIKYYLMIKNEK